MKTLGRLVFGAGIAAAIVLGLNLSAPDALRQWGLESDGFFESICEKQREELLAEELDARDRRVLENMEAKRRVIQGVMAQRLTLREAGERFQELNETCPEFNRERFRKTYPGKTDEERNCRQVIAYLKVYVQRDGSASRELIARLTNELEESIASF